MQFMPRAHVCVQATRSADLPTPARITCCCIRNTRSMRYWLSLVSPWPARFRVGIGGTFIIHIIS